MKAFDANAVARLEKHYSSPQILEQRRRLRAVLSPRPGESGLDVGCGVAYLACELAREVAPGGKIVAIDRSPHAIEAATARVAEAHLDTFVDVRLGDAADLHFPDETFDFAVGAQVYCYVADVARAMQEAARVLRKGGRLVVLDSDWDMCIWGSTDRSLARRIVASRGAVHFAHPHLPRELNRLIGAAGMRMTDVQAFPIIETRYDPNSYGAGMIEQMRGAALKQGISADEVSAWVEDLHARAAEGEWFFCLNRFIFTATK